MIVIAATISLAYVFVKAICVVRKAKVFVTLVAEVLRIEKVTVDVFVPVTGAMVSVAAGVTASIVSVSTIPHLTPLGRATSTLPEPVILIS